MLRRPALMVLLLSLLALALAGCGAKSQPESDYAPPAGASSADGGAATPNDVPAPAQGTGREYE